MRYWWVNQNQTYEHEVTGGYLWSPKKNANGARNQFYDYMLEVEPGDLVFSFKDTYIKAIGVVSSKAISTAKPKEFGKAGEYWSTDGWLVNVEFLLAPNPIRPKSHMNLLRDLLPTKYSPLTSEGNGLQGVYLTEVPQQMGSVLMNLLGNPELSMPVVDLSQLTFDSEEQQIIADNHLVETEKKTLVMARRGQGLFRTRVQLIEQHCRVTGVSSEKLLIASHIKPWKESDNVERINGNNGLFLSPHVDKLFDSGFITFTSVGEMVVSPLLDDDVLPKWNINASRRYGKFNSEQAFFLDFHQRDRFRAA